ncbi:acyl carrier protein [[Clostridium] asparagiforme DSM 15981]|nr:acyl carrier protein [[Clostridium] asparagiforme DSM 15981]
MPLRAAAGCPWEHGVWLASFAKIEAITIKARNQKEECKKTMEFEKLQAIIAEVLNIEPEEVTMQSTFVDDLGADSLDIFQIIMGIEEEFDIEIPNEAAEQIVTVGDAIEQIKNALN